MSRRTNNLLRIRRRGTPAGYEMSEMSAALGTRGTRGGGVTAAGAEVRGLLMVASAPARSGTGARSGKGARGATGGATAGAGGTAGGAGTASTGAATGDGGAGTAGAT